MHTRHYMSERGFSLIEMLVVVSIIVVIVAAMLMQSSRNRYATDLRNAAESFSLDIREMQSYALGVRAEGSQFSGSYGLNFVRDIDNSTDDQVYLSFIDEDKDGEYDVSGDVLLQTLTLPENIQIDSIARVGSGSGSGVVAPGGNDGLTIVFDRPKADARITHISSSNSYVWGGVTIVLEHANNTSLTETITVLDTGHVRIE